MRQPRPGSRNADFVGENSPPRRLLGRSRRWLQVSTLAGLGLGLGAALAAAAPPNPVTPIVEAGTIRFAVGLAENAERWLLTVSGPDDFYLRQEFTGTEPRLFLGDRDGESTVAGSYVWELRSIAEEGERLVRSGHFRVEAGAVLLPDASVTEGSPETSSRDAAVGRSSSTTLVGDPLPRVLNHSGDFYIGPDMGVGGRLAFGNAIDGTESLGFGSMLVQEDNIRLRFDDVSTVSGFPTRNWQITVNGAAISSGEYFVIEDLDGSTKPLRIDGGASDDSIRIDQNGRVGIGTATPGTLLHVAGAATIDGDLSVLSSRRAKVSFADIDGREVLARLAELPVLEWSYLGREARHLGPVAEDFHAVFRLGRDERSINPLDLGGVALAAIQGLQAEVAELTASNLTQREQAVRREQELGLLRRDRDALLERIETLESLMADVAARVEPRSPSP